MCWVFAIFFFSVHLMNEIKITKNKNRGDSKNPSFSASNISNNKWCFYPATKKGHSSQTPVENQRFWKKPWECCSQRISEPSVLLQRNILNNWNHIYLFQEIHFWKHVYIYTDFCSYVTFTGRTSRDQCLAMFFGSKNIKMIAVVGAEGLLFESV